MDSQMAQYMAAHIEAMREQTKSNVLLSKAILEQTEVISQLVNAIVMMIDTDSPDPDEEVVTFEGAYLLDGTRVS
jgi:hypothetical protein